LAALHELVDGVPADPKELPRLLRGQVRQAVEGLELSSFIGQHGRLGCHQVAIIRAHACSFTGGTPSRRTRSNSSGGIRTSLPTFTDSMRPWRQNAYTVTGLTLRACASSSGVRKEGRSTAVLI